jgi:small subunit ribosomal protein S16
MNEPADGATTLKKKAAEKLAAKAAPVVEEAPVAQEAPTSQEAPATEVVEVVAPVAEAPAEVIAEAVAEETPQA